jgi:hypothetical protein
MRLVCNHITCGTREIFYFLNQVQVFGLFLIHSFSVFLTGFLMEPILISFGLNTAGIRSAFGNRQVSQQYFLDFIPISIQFSSSQLKHL